MKYTKKIPLKDLDLEYRRVLRPAVPVKKSALSLEIKRILNNRKKNDHEKVKDYINALHRYINVRDKIPQSPTDRLDINPITEPVPPPLFQLPPPPPPEAFAYIAADDDRETPKPKKRKTISPEKRQQAAKRKAKPKKRQILTKKWDTR